MKLMIGLLKLLFRKGRERRRDSYAIVVIESSVRRTDFGAEVAKLMGWDHLDLRLGAVLPAGKIVKTVVSRSAEHEPGSVIAGLTVRVDDVCDLGINFDSHHALRQIMLALRLTDKRKKYRRGALRK